MLYTVFCDESCHLQMDNSSVMVLGAMYCFSEKRKQIYSDIRAIKEKHGLNKMCIRDRNRADRPCFPKRCGMRYH